MTEHHEHNQSIIHQFSRQALPFSNVPAHSDSAALHLLLEFSEASPEDLVLDVACGPGIVTCAFAATCAHVTGIDITPAMIDRARSIQRERELSNLSWAIGDVRNLPFPDNSFSLVVTRFTFHHLLDCDAVLAEMKRVCRPGGRVLVVDVAPEKQHQAAYDEVEILRDPSHVRALNSDEFEALFVGAGLTAIRSTRYLMEMELDRQLCASFPNPGDETRIRQIYASDIGGYKLGLNVRDSELGILYSIPILAMLGVKL